MDSYLEVAEHLCHNDEIKQIYAKHIVTIERDYTDTKENHGIRWTKLSMHAMFTFAAMNLKKMQLGLSNLLEWEPY